MGGFLWGDEEFLGGGGGVSGRGEESAALIVDAEDAAFGSEAEVAGGDDEIPGGELMGGEEGGEVGAGGEWSRPIGRGGGL